MAKKPQKRKSRYADNDRKVAAYVAAYTSLFQSE